MTTTNRLAVAALALGIAGVFPTVASAHDGHRHHHRHHHHGYGHHYGPYAHRYAPVRYVYVDRPVYTRVIYDDYRPYYPRHYRYDRHRYARPGLSVSVRYADGPYYGGYRYRY